MALWRDGAPDWHGVVRYAERRGYRVRLLDDGGWRMDSPDDVGVSYHATREEAEQAARRHYEAARRLRSGEQS